MLFLVAFDEEDQLHCEERQIDGEVDAEPDGEYLNIGEMCEKVYREHGQMEEERTDGDAHEHLDECTRVFEDALRDELQHHARDDGKVDCAQGDGNKEGVPCP